MPRSRALLYHPDRSAGSATAGPPSRGNLSASRGPVALPAALHDPLKYARVERERRFLVADIPGGSSRSGRSSTTTLTEPDYGSEKSSTRMAA